MNVRRTLPKNVRQVGEKDGTIKIYVEDYVNTYLEKCMSRQGELTIGVLVGESCVIDGNACQFVTGALEVNHVWSEEEQLLFSEYSWERMLEAKSRHFGDVEICGCFVCAGEEIIPDQTVLSKLSNRYFPEAGSIMLVASREDSAVYYQAVAGMTRLSGFYIYFERNEAMQSFLVENNQGRVVERPGGEVVVNQFREKMSEKKASKNPAGFRLAYGLVFCLALFMCAIGINTLGSSKKLEEMEKLLASVLESGAAVSATLSETDSAGGRLTIYDVTGEASSSDDSDAWTATGSEEETSENSLPSEETPPAETVNDTGSGEIVPTDSTQTGVLPTETQPLESIPEETLPAETETPPATDETINEASVIPENCSVYKVAEGDTLSSICVRLYGSHEYMETICQLNGLTDPNLISLGQELIVPDTAGGQVETITPQ